MKDKERGKKREYRWNQVVNMMNSLRWWSVSSGWNEGGGGEPEILKGRGKGGVWIIAFHLDNHSI